jgi:hypothetical protein
LGGIVGVRAEEPVDTAASTARPETRSFGEPSLIPTAPLFVGARDFLRRDVTAIATLDGDGSPGGLRFGERGHHFSIDGMCLGLTREAPAGQSHQAKRHQVLRLPSKSGGLKRDCNEGIEHLHLQRAATPPTTPTRLEQNALTTERRLYRIGHFTKLIRGDVLFKEPATGGVG